MPKSDLQSAQMSERKALNKLRSHLKSINAGPIFDTSILESLLAPCWDQFAGSDEERMDGHKLHGRMENVSWDPPELSFKIERHGETAYGSSKASIHKYRVNVDEKTADREIAGHRQLRPMNKRLDVKPIAQEVAKLILDNRHDDRLKWSSNDKVTVLIGKIILADSAPSQTVAGRRKRYRKVVDELLTTSGWKIVRANVYTRIDQTV
jgi:hypothetical protein